jgi:hypothetical protein
VRPLAALLVLVGAGCGGSTPVLSVDEAANHEGRATVTGFLHAESGTVRLCAAVLESFPPQCGRPALAVVGLDVDSVDGLQRSGAVAWKEGVTLEGAIADGVIRVESE